MKVYTDGSCLGNPGRGGWGFIAVSDDGDELYRDGDFGGDRVTNNIMELTAMLKALRWIFSLHRASGGIVHDDNVQDIVVSADVIVYTDSNYVCQGICSWMKKWKRMDSKSASGGDVKNRALWEAIDDVLTRLGDRVCVEWVRAHCGNEWNEAVDDYARAFANIM